MCVTLRRGRRLGREEECCLVTVLSDMSEKDKPYDFTCTKRH